MFSNIKENPSVSLYEFCTLHQPVQSTKKGQKDFIYPRNRNLENSRLHSVHSLYFRPDLSFTCPFGPNIDHDIERNRYSEREVDPHSIAPSSFFCSEHLYGHVLSDQTILFLKIKVKPKLKKLTYKTCSSSSSSSSIPEEEEENNRPNDHYGNQRLKKDTYIRNLIDNEYEYEYEKRVFHYFKIHHISIVCLSYCPQSMILFLLGSRKGKTFTEGDKRKPNGDDLSIYWIQDLSSLWERSIPVEELENLSEKRNWENEEKNIVAKASDTSVYDYLDAKLEAYFQSHNSLYRYASIQHYFYNATKKEGKQNDNIAIGQELEEWCHFVPLQFVKEQSKCFNFVPMKSILCCHDENKFTGEGNKKASKKTYGIIVGRDETTTNLVIVFLPFDKKNSDFVCYFLHMIGNKNEENEIQGNTKQKQKQPNQMHQQQQKQNNHHCMNINDLVALYLRKTRFIIGGETKQQENWTSQDQDYYQSENDATFNKKKSKNINVSSIMLQSETLQIDLKVNKCRQREHTDDNTNDNNKKNSHADDHVLSSAWTSKRNMESVLILSFPDLCISLEIPFNYEEIVSRLSRSELNRNPAFLNASCLFYYPLALNYMDKNNQSLNKSCFHSHSGNNVHPQYSMRYQNEMLHYRNTNASTTSDIPLIQEYQMLCCLYIYLTSLFHKSLCTRFTYNHLKNQKERKISFTLEKFPFLKLSRPFTTNLDASTTLRCNDKPINSNEFCRFLYSLQKLEVDTKFYDDKHNEGNEEKLEEEPSPSSLSLIEKLYQHDEYQELFGQCHNKLYHRFYFVENDMLQDQYDTISNTIVLKYRYIILVYHLCQTKATWLIVYRIFEDPSVDFELVQTWNFSKDEKISAPSPLTKADCNQSKAFEWSKTDHKYVVGAMKDQKIQEMKTKSGGKSPLIYEGYDDNQKGYSSDDMEMLLEEDLLPIKEGLSHLHIPLEDRTLCSESNAPLSQRTNHGIAPLNNKESHKNSVDNISRCQKNGKRSRGNSMVSPKEDGTLSDTSDEWDYGEDEDEEDDHEDEDEDEVIYRGNERIIESVTSKSFSQKKCYENENDIPIEMQSHGVNDNDDFSSGDNYDTKQFKNVHHGSGSYCASCDLHLPRMFPFCDHVFNSQNQTTQKRTGMEEIITKNKIIGVSTESQLFHIHLPICVIISNQKERGEDKKRKRTGPEQNIEEKQKEEMDEHALHQAASNIILRNYLLSSRSNPRNPLFSRFLMTFSGKEFSKKDKLVSLWSYWYEFYSSSSGDISSLMPSTTITDKYKKMEPFSSCSTLASSPKISSFILRIIVTFLLRLTKRKEYRMIAKVCFFLYFSGCSYDTLEGRQELYLELLQYNYFYNDYENFAIYGVLFHFHCLHSEYPSLFVHNSYAMECNDKSLRKAVECCNHVYLETLLTIFPGSISIFDKDKDTLESTKGPTNHPNANMTGLDSSPLHPFNPFLLFHFFFSIKKKKTPENDNATQHEDDEGNEKVQEDDYSGRQLHFNMSLVLKMCLARMKCIAGIWAIYVNYYQDKNYQEAVGSELHGPAELQTITFLHIYLRQQNQLQGNSEKLKENQLNLFQDYVLVRWLFRKKFNLTLLTFFLPSVLAIENEKFRKPFDDNKKGNHEGINPFSSSLHVSPLSSPPFLNMFITAFLQLLDSVKPCASISFLYFDKVVSNYPLNLLNLMLTKGSYFLICFFANYKKFNFSKSKDKMESVETLARRIMNNLLNILFVRIDRSKEFDEKMIIEEQETQHKTEAFQSATKTSVGKNEGKREGRNMQNKEKEEKNDFELLWMFLFPKEVRWRPYLSMQMEEEHDKFITIVKEDTVRYLRHLFLFLVSYHSTKGYNISVSLSKVIQNAIINAKSSDINSSDSNNLCFENEELFQKILHHQSKKEKGNLQTLLLNQQDQLKLMDSLILLPMLSPKEIEEEKRLLKKGRINEDNGKVALNTYDDYPFTSTFSTPYLYSLFYDQLNAAALASLLYKASLPIRSVEKKSDQEQKDLQTLKQRRLNTDPFIHLQRQERGQQCIGSNLQGTQYDSNNSEGSDDKGFHAKKYTARHSYRLESLLYALIDLKEKFLICQSSSEKVKQASKDDAMKEDISLDDSLLTLLERKFNKDQTIKKLENFCYHLHLRTKASTTSFLNASNEPKDTFVDFESSLENNLFDIFKRYILDTLQTDIFSQLSPMVISDLCSESYLKSIDNNNVSFLNLVSSTNLNVLLTMFGVLQELKASLKSILLCWKELQVNFMSMEKLLFPSISSMDSRAKKNKKGSEYSPLFFSPFQLSPLERDLVLGLMLLLFDDIEAEVEFTSKEVSKNEEKKNTENIITTGRRKNVGTERSFTSTAGILDLFSASFLVSLFKYYQSLPLSPDMKNLITGENFNLERLLADEKLLRLYFMFTEQKHEIKKETSIPNDADKLKSFLDSTRVRRHFVKSVQRSNELLVESTYENPYTTVSTPQLSTETIRKLLVKKLFGQSSDHESSSIATHLTGTNAEKESSSPILPCHLSLERHYYTLPPSNLTNNKTQTFMISPEISAPSNSSRGIAVAKRHEKQTKLIPPKTSKISDQENDLISKASSNLEKMILFPCGHIIPIKTFKLNLLEIQNQIDDEASNPISSNPPVIPLSLSMSFPLSLQVLLTEYSSLVEEALVGKDTASTFSCLKCVLQAVSSMESN